MSAEIPLAQPTWPTLFDACQPLLLRHLSRRLGSAEDARDLCQETWLRIAEAAESGRDMCWSSEDAAKAYVFTVANHLAVDRLRRSVVRQDYLQDLAERSVRSSPDVADGVSYRQAIAAVDQVVSGFPARMREVFIRHRVHGEKQEAIANALGVSQNTIERDIMQADNCLESALLRWRGGPPELASQHKRGSGTRRKALCYLLGVAGVSTGSLRAWRAWHQRLLWERTVASSVGQLRTTRLDDGSELNLDSDSEVILQFRADERAARLSRGAAFFSVARDETRPFLVRASGVEVEVLGTRFGVALEANAVLVEVEQGLVQVRPQGSMALILTAGDRLRVPLPELDQEATLVKDQTESPAAWRGGELMFDRTRLGDAVARLQRHSHQRLEVAKGAQDLLVSGHVRVASARGWINALPDSLPVSVVGGPNASVLVTMR